MREENKKVYAFYKSENKEMLIYDFNLKEGEYLNDNSDNSIYINKIDSVEITGKLRKRFTTRSGDAWIEGIGSLGNDFVYPTYAHPAIYFCGINYQKKGDEIIYKTDQSYFIENECLKAGVRKEKVDKFYTAVPNPVIDKSLKINLAQGIYTEIEFLNPAGQLIYSKIINDDASVEINAESLQSGIYFLKLKSDTKTITEKIIVN